MKLDLLLDTISPLKLVSKRTALTLLGGTVAFLGLIWTLSPSPLLPTPPEVWQSFLDLSSDGLMYQLGVSYILNLQAIGWAVVVSLGLSYLSVVPLFNPIVNLSTSLRFLSFAGLSIAFAVIFTSKHEIKVVMLAFSISVWFVTAMLDVIKAIPQEQYDLARTLRMGEWRVVWEVVVLGQMDKVFDVLRQTAAMGWMMLTMVESVAYSEGGIGTVLQNVQKHVRLADIMAIQLCIMFMGIVQDYLIGFLKTQFCPYAGKKAGGHCKFLERTKEVVEQKKFQGWPSFIGYLQDDL